MPRHWYRWRGASYNICPLEFSKMSCWLNEPFPLSVARAKSEHKVGTNAVIEPRLVTGGCENFQTEDPCYASQARSEPVHQLKAENLSATKGQMMFLCNDWSRSQENIGWPWENHLVWVTGCIILLWMLYFCTQWLLRMLCVLRPAKHMYVGYLTATYNIEAEQVDNQLLYQRAVLMS